MTHLRCALDTQMEAACFWVSAWESLRAAAVRSVLLSAQQKQNSPRHAHTQPPSTCMPCMCPPGVPPCRHAPARLATIRMPFAGDVPFAGQEKMIYTPLIPGWQTHYYTVKLEEITIDGTKVNVAPVRVGRALCSRHRVGTSKPQSVPTVLWPAFRCCAYASTHMSAHNTLITCGQQESQRPNLAASIVKYGCCCMSEPALAQHPNIGFCALIPF